MTEEDLHRIISEHNDRITSQKAIKKQKNKAEYQLRRSQPITEYRGTDQKVAMENARASAVVGLKGKSKGVVSRKMKKIYIHLPADMVKYITNVYLRNHK
jgi:hypothetical protein